MNTKIRRKRPKYPFGTSGVYTSVILCLLSFVLAVLLLSEKPWFLPYYFIFSISIAVVVFVVKNYILSVRESRLYQNNTAEAQEEKEGGTRWGLLILAFLGLLLLIALPLALSNFLEPVLWVILLVSFSTGVSAAEFILYLYLRRPSKT